MRLVGRLGLKSVLTKLGVDVSSMNAEEMKEKLYRWKEVVEQRTALEAIAESESVLLLYITKSHPWLNMIEKLFRLHKAQWKKHPSTSSTALKSFVDKQLDEDPDLGKIKEWWALVQKYAHYHSSGFDDFLTEERMKKLNASKLRAPQSPLSGKSFSLLKSSFHSLNWRLKVSKNYPEGREVWRARWPVPVKRKAAHLPSPTPSKKGRFDTNPTHLQEIEVFFPFVHGESKGEFHRGYVQSVRGQTCRIVFDDGEIANFSWPKSKGNPWAVVIENNREVFRS